MWKFKSWKGKDKCLFLLSIGAILCILAFPAENLGRKVQKESTAGQMPAAKAGEEMSNAAALNSEVSNSAAQEASASVQATYEGMLERRVKEVLKHVEGVGNVDVLIVLKSSAEKVIQTDSDYSRSSTEEKDTSGGVRKIENEEQEQTAIFSGSDSGRTPVIQKELYPEISGIVISAEGGGNAAVSAEISAAMEALFGLPAHKIKVLKRVE